MMNKNDDIDAHIREICAEAAVPWRERIAGSIPGTGAFPARGEADSFSNVRSFIIDETIERVLEGIITHSSRDRMKESMVTWMKLQALEAGSPEDAVVFLHHLKSIVHDSTHEDGARSDAARFIEASMDEWINAATELYRETRALLPDLMLREKRRTGIRVLSRNRNREAPG